MRLVKVGGKTYDVTDGVQKVAKEFDCVPVEGKRPCAAAHLVEPRLTARALRPSISFSGQLSCNVSSSSGDL